MLDVLGSNPLYFAVWLVSILVAITVHEASHALAADRLGDPTPRLQGRLSLNPLAHLDPVGTILLILFRFGWGKPVQFDPYNLDNPRRDAALISIAGPLSNLVLAILASLLIRFVIPAYYSSLLYPFVFMNVGLAIFNLVPVHPLDGSKIIIWLLPLELANEWQIIMNRYGMFILLLLVLPFWGTSPILSIVNPVVTTILNILLPY